MLKKNQMINGIISYMNEVGKGVLLKNGDKIYISNVLEKEKVQIQIMNQSKRGYEARLIKILEASPNRKKVDCEIFERCGSCTLLHMDYQKQLEAKKRRLNQLMKQLKQPISISNIYGMKQPIHYRNKIIIGFQKDRNKQLIAGFYEESTHQIISYKRCLLHPPICDDIIQTILSLVKKYKIEPYDEDTRSGDLRHVILRYGMVSKEVMVTIVYRQREFKGSRNFVRVLVEKHPEIKSVILNVNPRKTSIVLGEEEKVLYGSGYIQDTLCGLNFHISSKSFYQINHDQCEVLYKKSIELLRLKGNETIIDAYCGIGTIGMYASQFVKQVYGVESNPKAIEDALHNANRNDIKNIRFICDDASDYLAKQASKHSHVDIVIMDPPRSGSTPLFIQSVARLKVKNVLYISCDPNTQIRDLKLFESLGYKVLRGFGVDMFVHTSHVESVVLLTKVHN